MKKILVSGCSFTETDRRSNWPFYLKDKLAISIRNLACAAAGNEYIANSIIFEILEKGARHYDMVLVMWSGLLRVDNWISSDVNKIYKDYSHLTKPAACNLICAPGSAILDTAHPAIRDLKKSRDLVMSDESRALLSVLNIIKLQDFLTLRKIPYLFMTYNNFWDNNARHSGSLSSINDYISVTNLFKEVDLSKFMFYREKSGHYEFSRDLTMLERDRFHPDAQASSLWADLIVKHLEGISFKGTI